MQAPAPGLTSGSSQPSPLRVPPAWALLPAAAAAAGLFLLTSRPLLPVIARSPIAHAILLASVYLATGALGLGAEVGPAETPRASRIFVLGLGVAAVIVVAVGTGPLLTAPATVSAVALSSAAAVSEEAFFRRFLFGWIARYGALLAVIVSAVCFAAVHVSAYGPASLPVNLGAGLLLSWQRWASGTWLVPAATHITANLLAYSVWPGP